MANERKYTSRRANILTALVAKFKTINGSGAMITDIADNVQPYLMFWDEVQEFPAIHLNAGSETREYQGVGYTDRFLTITVRCYVNEENAQDALNALIEDVETVVEENSRLEYFDRLNATHTTHQITIVSIDTDDGVLEPMGVGEILLEVRY